MLRAIALLALVVAAAVGGPAGGPAPTAEDLAGPGAGDDECLTAKPGDAGCALSALQRQVRRVSAAEEGAQADAEADAEEDVEADDDAEAAWIEPDLKEYFNVSLSALGADELQGLIDNAQGELARRGTTEPEVAALGESGGELGAATRCPFRPFTGGPRSALCFCQLAKNSGCSSQRCACRQGCNTNRVTWNNAETVTFKNKARAYTCSPSTVLLTAPKSYFSTPDDLKRSCGGASVSVVETLLRDSWNVFHSHVGKGALNQCFHSSHIASVKYLHLQSFCAHGNFHAMPTSNPGVGSCVKMSSLDQAPALAKQLYHMMI